MRKLHIILPLILLSISAYALRPEDVENVQLSDHDRYVTDMCGVFTDAERSQLDARCVRLREQVGVELAIVVVDEIEDDDEYKFAYELFNLWHIGDKRNNSGVLWLYVKSIRAMKIETGVGVEGLLTDGFLKRTLENEVFPLMKEGKTYQAFTNGMEAIETQLTSEQARQELVIDELDDRTFLVDIFALYFSAGFLLMALLAIWYYNYWKKMKGDNNMKYKLLSSEKSPYNFIKFFTFIFPIPLLALFWIVRRGKRALRYLPITCPNCGNTMRVLSEAEEDTYLNHVQQEEENLHTVDYDVWLCPGCGATKILNYEEYASKMYKRCPKCGGRTFQKTSEKLIIPPTPLTSGRGERVYHCTACGATERIPFTIPPVPIIIGGSGRGGHSGGFGGGFGGGFSAGGGAGGRF